MCLVFYGFLDFSHWCVICCTTTGTVAFLIAKVAGLYMYRHNSLPHSKGSRVIYVQAQQPAFLIATVYMYRHSSLPHSKGSKCTYVQAHQPSSQQRQQVYLCTGTVAFLIAKVASVFMYRHSSLAFLIAKVASVFMYRHSSLPNSKGSRSIYVQAQYPASQQRQQGYICTSTVVCLPHCKGSRGIYVGDGMIFQN